MNAIIPMCKIHGVEMRTGKVSGSFFCSRKMADGTFCREVVHGPKPDGPARQTTSAPSNRQLMTIAALDFASRVFQGTADPDSALDLADRLIKRFEGEA